MIPELELNVTLSRDLLRHLRAEARRLDVPLEWLVAGLVADTVDEADMESAAMAIPA